MLTLDSEIASIWKAKWNYTKVLYLLCRYFHFIDFPLFVRCELLYVIRMFAASF